MSETRQQDELWAVESDIEVMRDFHEDADGMAEIGEAHTRAGVVARRLPRDGSPA